MEANLIEEQHQKDVVSICASFNNQADALIEILHLVQEEYGYLNDASLIKIAHALNLSKADVLGVVSFYQDFKRSAPPKYILKICGAEACQAVGCRSLIDYAAAQCRNNGYADTEVEIVYCLGNCALGPAVMVNETLHGKMTAERLDLLMATCSFAKGFAGKGND